ncbi:hypothetical protein FRC11_008461 [Ceratobasidium sp. 423]|nr:hypothetical protein FRC11_008461 [Ceratobasidium sp. 423]
MMCSAVPPISDELLRTLVEAGLYSEERINKIWEVVKTALDSDGDFKEALEEIVHVHMLHENSACEAPSRHGIELIIEYMGNVTAKIHGCTQQELTLLYHSFFKSLVQKHMNEAVDKWVAGGVKKQASPYEPAHTGLLKRYTKRSRKLILGPPWVRQAYGAKLPLTESNTLEKITTFHSTERKEDARKTIIEQRDHTGKYSPIDPSSCFAEEERLMLLENGRDDSYSSSNDDEDMKVTDISNRKYSEPIRVPPRPKDADDYSSDSSSDDSAILFVWQED